MSISLKTHKMLWGRSGNMCAFPGCGKVLVVDETSTDDPSIIGEEAHIVGQKDDGPRGNSQLPIEKRDMYSNLLLLCSVHHKIIDDQESEYTVEKLIDFKNQHEKRVLENMVSDTSKIKDDERYAAYIQHITELCDLPQWNNWTSYILGSSEMFPKKQFDSISKIPEYILGRIWPGRYCRLEAALHNFNKIISDLLLVYNMHKEDHTFGYFTEKFYKEYNGSHCHFEGVPYNPIDEQEALRKYEYHISLIEDLIIELTRAANFLCDNIREFIFEGFRIEEGALLITRGDLLSGFKTYRVEYRGQERTEFPYPGLKNFMNIRTTRDLFIGDGIDERYFKNPLDFH